MTSAPFDPIVVGESMLRKLEPTDLATTRAWRNHPDSRAWFLTSDVVTAEGHEAWYAAYLERDDDFVFIVERSGVPVAQVAIYRIDRTDRVAEFGRLLVDPDRRGEGISHVATDLCIIAARDRLHLSSLVLEVKATNERAIRAYERAGFIATAPAEDDVLAMTLDFTPGSARG